MSKIDRGEPVAAPMAVNVNEACRQLSLSRTTLYVMIREGELRSVIVGGRRLIPMADLERLVNAA